MYRKSLLILLLAVLFPGGVGQILAGTAEISHSFIPENLRCEYMVNPLGVDQKIPRFSWNYAPARPDYYGQKQTAWRILVSESRQDLQENKGTSWDSGWVNSSQMSQVEYAGKPLQSDRIYNWTVQVKNERGAILTAAKPAFWSTGLFDQKEWTAQWIGSDEIYDYKRGLHNQDSNIYDPWFRKTFEIQSVPGQAMLFIASIGYHEIYINGKRVGKNVLAPNVTDHTKRARYIVYDVCTMLKPGKNVIAVWLGTSWSIFPPYTNAGLVRTPQFILQMDLHFKTDSVIRIVSDASWKTHSSPNLLLGNWNFGSFGGEHWIEDRAIPDWNLLKYNDSDWKQATIYSPKPLALLSQMAKTDPQNPILQDNLLLKDRPLPLTAQIGDQNIMTKEIHPVTIEDKGNGVWRVDMGVNFAGWTEIKVKGKPGSTVDFIFSEAPQKEITFGIRSKYTFGPSGQGTFKNRFNYSSGRWITIRGLEEKPQLSDIRGWSVRTGYQNAASFQCSDPLLNWIYNTVCWTYENLSLGGYIVDCPQRERLGYGGDAHATCETGMYNYDLPAFYYKWTEDWRDVQGREPLWMNLNDPAIKDQEGGGRYFCSGILPNTAPTYSGGGGTGWGGICVTLPWYLYLQYNDKRVLTENFGMITDWLAFLDLHVENDLLQKYGMVWSFLGDWLWPGAAGGPNSDTPEALFFNNCYRVFNLTTAADIAEVLGKTDRAEQWRIKANNARKAIHKKYFHSEDNSYLDGSQTSMAAALVAEIPPKAIRADVMKRLEKEIMVNCKGHIGAGITGGSMLFKLLRAENRTDLVYSMLSQKEYPGWGFMKDCDATTIWEAWEKDKPGHSLLHSSYLFPGSWYIDSVLGIRRDPQMPGFQNFVIRPPVWGSIPLTSAKGFYRSIAGRIESSWKKVNDKTWAFDISVPPNTGATVFVPSPDGPDHISSIPQGLQPLRNEGDYTVFSVPSGIYHFEINKQIK